MDRIEKALEKARLQREMAGVNTDYSQGSRVIAPRLPDVPVFAPVPESFRSIEKQLERHRVIARQPRNPQADIFRMLRTKILQIMTTHGYRTLAITSPNYGDGKTTTALNLGLSLALDVKQTVLLVDLDMRKPSLHEFLGITPEVGLSDYLLRDVPVAKCLIRPPFDRVSIFPAGKPLDNSSEMLGSPKMAALAEELKRRYPDRMIIYDMPPVLAQDDSIAFLPNVEAVLLVVRDGVTKTDQVKQCLQSLSKANVIGTVLNNSGDAKTNKQVPKH
jgi:protein-tyrosine kinase